MYLVNVLVIRKKTVDVLYFLEKQKQPVLNIIKITRLTTEKKASIC